MNQTPSHGSATFTVELAREEVPLAVVVLYGTDAAVQVTNVGGVPDRVVADAMVAAAFELNEMADLQVPHAPVPRRRRDGLYDVESDGL